MAEWPTAVQVGDTHFPAETHRNHGLQRLSPSVNRTVVVLELNRPDDGEDLDATWDGVFNTCPGLFEEDSVNDLEVDNWRVKLAGDQVRVQFIRALPLSGTIDGVDVEVTLQLIDRGPYDFDGDNSFLPVSGESKTYNLDDYSIFGTSVKGTHPRLQCGNGEQFDGPLNIDLVITAAP